MAERSYEFRLEGLSSPSGEIALRLAGIGAGSTVLEVRLGEADALELPGGDEEAVADRFEELFSAIAASHRPEWAEAPVIEAVGRFAATVAACGATALTASRRRNDTLVPWQVIDVASVDGTVWKVKATLASEHTAIAGWLDKGRSARTQVPCTWVAERERGKVVRIVEPSLEAEELPAGWASQPTVGMLNGIPSA